MRRILFLPALLMTISIAGRAEEPRKALLYKSPQCGCCEKYATYLHRNGFDVTVKPTQGLASISRTAGVPAHLGGCQTMFVDGFVVEGHLPVDVVRRLLSERPPIAGVSLPGMPAGSPGMSGTKTEPFVIYSLPKDGGDPAVYATE